MQRDIAREHVRGLGAQRSRAGSWRDSRAAGGAHSTQAPTLESTEQGTLGARAPSTEALALFPSIASSWLQNQGHSISDGKRLRARRRERTRSETTSMEFKCRGRRFQRAFSFFPSTARRCSLEAEVGTGVGQKWCRTLALPLAGPEYLGRFSGIPENWKQHGVQEQASPPPDKATASLPRGSS